jgi:hypothetical protein
MAWYLPQRGRGGGQICIAGAAKFNVQTREHYLTHYALLNIHLFVSLQSDLRSQNLDNSFKRDIYAHLFDASYHKHKCSGIPLN